MLREKFYPKLSSILNSCADMLNRKGIHPNQLTLGGAALSLAAGLLFAKNYLFIGALFMGIGGLCDAVDGPLARISGKMSDFGAFFDSTMDRFADGFVLGGLVLYFFNQDEPFWITVVLGILIASFAVSYIKARAENYIENCSAGIFTRETRFAAIGFGVLFPPLLKPLLLVAFFGSAWTVYQRIVYTRDQLEKSVPSAT